MRRREIGEADVAAQARHDARHFELDPLEACEERETIPRFELQCVRRTRRQQHRVGLEELEHALRIIGEQRGLDLRGAQGIHPEHPERPVHRPRPFSQRCVEVEDRARHGNARLTGERRVQGLPEPRPTAAHLEIRLAGHGAHRERELVQRRAVHEVHGKAERHAQRDAGRREQCATPLVCKAGAHAIECAAEVLRKCA